MSAKKKLAIFDLDGTLFDTEEIHYLSYKQALQEVGIELDRTYFAQNCYGRHYKAFLVHLLKCEGELSYSGEEVEKSENEELLARVKDVHDRKIELYVELVHAARENLFLFDMIRAIKSEYYVACVTTASKKNVMGILDYSNKTELFDLIITQEDVEKAKPDPEAFLKAADYFQIPISEAVIFEDSETGLCAARASGAQVMKVEKW